MCTSLYGHQEKILSLSTEDGNKNDPYASND